jgi:hypothetical protein
MSTVDHDQSGSIDFWEFVDFFHPILVDQEGKSGENIQKQMDRHLRRQAAA